MTVATPRPGLELGVAHFSSIALPPKEFAGIAARAGFASIGLRLHPAFPGAPFYELPVGSQSAQEFKTVADGEGIKVFDIEFFVIDESFVAASHEATVAAAANIGARRLSVCGDDRDGGRLATNLSEFCALAARYGMSVDIENMGWRTVRTFRDSVAVVNSCGAENAGVLVDGIHFFRNGASIDELRANAGKIKHVQLCDVRGPAPKTSDAMIAEARSGRLAPGEGELPLKDLWAATEYGAAISVEVPLVGPVDPEAHLKHLHDSALGILKPDH
ncbi:sugar phosphate isomerase [Sinorhizobium fredii USDA 205]|uniref:Sugar phosphate isomerase/epimerase n=1 Tax=Rhizobium fredii TaxID=380 RepID=A0A2A6LQM5_RHIFR|nr:sugar phosphate isomerase/epimerase [Sinorhizobium fredii]KSV81132.1 sugar phosphate isomerase [Sinorhizobium fredii USDA 205]MQW98888.1 TIM barrel protein [Sinorhizobium fredii]MQX12049.1 TIM barrel protein [Sinorhizobium fredii]PDT44532.1 sugar phosphate isomerase/epimerase [Sinorhizobium fredii]GEC34803.1 sugar phosphate isomerase [Sinorhizobium fredii]